MSVVNGLLSVVLDVGAAFQSRLAELGEIPSRDCKVAPTSNQLISCVLNAYRWSK
jgi:hypothetical protein